MQIDRSKFLLLTATMASGACGSGASSSPSAGPGPVVAAPIVALPAAGGEPGEQGKPAGSSGGEGEDPVLAALEPAEAGGEDLSDPSMCDEGGAPPRNCGTLRTPSGPQCESFGDTHDMCVRLARGLLPRVATKAVDCILAKSGTQAICHYDVASRCAVAAVLTACVDPATQSTCAPAVRACNGRLSMKDCQSLLSAVTKKNRREMIACVTEGCSIDYCMYSVQ